MMIVNSRECYQAKQEGDTINMEKFSKAPTTSRQWSGFRNPRIVRVSRSFGGKDRHSKVCTVRGLRDRRIRLSVPTAIQLYDLQDRLGLTQPSKVIDWLLEATKHDIDRLPPLQIPQGFAQFHQQNLLPHHESSASYLGAFYDGNSAFIKDGGNHDVMAKSRYWDIDAVSKLKGKEDERGSTAGKGKWIKTSEHENEDEIGGYNSSQVTVQKLFPIGAHSSLPGLLNNAMTYNSYHSEPSSLSLSQFGSHGLLPSQVDSHSSSNNGVQFPSSLPVPSAGSQLFFCNPTSTPSHFSPYAPYITTSVVDNDPRQFNHIQFLSSSSQVLPHTLVPSLQSINNSLLKPLPTPFSSKLLDFDSNNRIHTDKDSTRS